MLNMLGLCARAGKLITGEKACVQAIRAGGAQVALLDGAASANAVKALTDACTSHGVPLVRTGNCALGDAIGKPGRMAAVVTDAGMAARIIELSDVDSIGDV
ncbi:MAG: ribosomal L7Ae/L30e/S12e/Gadd45 family protein [Eubacteriales bacterium]